MGVSVDFLEDLKSQFSDWLGANGHATDGDLRALVLRYQNATRRIPPAIKWKLQLSRELSDRTLVPEIENGLAYFMSQARGGADLRPFLSQKVSDAESPDLMFYDWGVYHFHLGTGFAKKGRRKGFIKGTDELLFAIADRDSGVMYLIDIHPHEGGFANQDLLRIIEENWPEVLDPYTLTDVTPSLQDLSDDDLGMLRDGGANVVVRTPGGRTLAPMGGGITTARTSMRDVMIADRLLFRVRQFQALLDENIGGIGAYFTAEHGVPENDLDLHAYLGASDTL